MEKMARNSILIFLSVTGLWIFLTAVDAFVWFELKLFDSIIIHSPQPLYDTGIVIIEYDDKTSDNLKSQFSVTDLAGLLHCIEEMNPRAVALDLFSMQSDLLHDDTLHILDSVVSQYENIIVGGAFVVPQKAQKPYPQEQGSFDCTAFSPFTYPLQKEDSRYYYYIEHILMLNPDIVPSIRSMGHLNLINDADGICRRIPGFISCNSRTLLPSFGLQAGIRFMNIDKEKIDFLRGSFFDTVNRTFPLPLDKFGQLVLQFNSNPYLFQEMPIIDFLSAYRDSIKRSGVERILRDKLVFVGNVSLRSGRFFATPFQPYYPSILIHATTARNLMTHSFITVSGSSAIYALILLFGLFILVSMVYLKTIRNTFWLLAYIPLLLLADIVLLVQHDFYIPVFSVLSYVFFLYFLLLIYRYIEYKNSLVSSLESMQKELLVKERMAAIGQVTAQTAHAIRNPLGIITLYTSHLRRNAQTAQERSGFLDIIDKEVSKLNSFLTNVMDLTKPIKMSLQPAALRDMLKDVEKCLVQYMKNKSIAIDITGVPDHVVIPADPNLMRDVFINLGRNSIDAMEEKGTIRISASKTDGQVSILFKDDGKGMTGEEARKAFNLFFTTKKEGNGLGLPMVKNIIEAHRGSIKLESTFGKGTEVTIDLPL